MPNRPPTYIVVCKAVNSLQSVSQIHNKWINADIIIKLCHSKNLLPIDITTTDAVGKCFPSTDSKSNSHIIIKRSINTQIDNERRTRIYGYLFEKNENDHSVSSSNDNRYSNLITDYKSLLQKITSTPTWSKLNSIFPSISTSPHVSSSKNTQSKRKANEHYSQERKKNAKKEK